MLHSLNYKVSKAAGDSHPGGAFSHAAAAKNGGGDSHSQAWSVIIKVEKDHVWGNRH